MAVRKRKFIYLLIALLLSACSPWIRTDQPARSGFFTLRAGGSLGQTFVARYDGLTGIALYLRPEVGGQGRAILYLRKNSLDPNDLAVSALPFQNISGPGYYRFQFPPLQGSAGQDYYLQLELDGQEKIEAGQADGSAYLNGAAYQDGSPQNAQLSFRLAYDPIPAISGLIREALFWLWLVAAAVFLFILPGWALLHLSFPSWSCLHTPEKLGLSAGVSLALYPLLFLWTGLAGLRLGPLYAWGPPLAGAAYLVWEKVKSRRETKDQRRRTDDGFVRPSSFVLRLSSTVFRPPSFVFRPSSLALIIVLFLILAVRFWAVRDLDAPLYGDSYQHTLITQLLVDHNGLFNSWQPYADLRTFTYHFGFHTAAAVYHWATGLAAPGAVLWVGQILNALAAFSIYPLAAKIGRNPWAGVIAVLLAGLLSPTPMFYTNWGRFTQLAGQVILPTAAYLLWDVLESKQEVRRQYLLAWLILAGLALTHYRVLIFGVLFLATGFFVVLVTDSSRNLIRKTFWIGAGAALLFLPWFIHVFAGRILRIFAAQVAAPTSPSSSGALQVSNLGDPLASLPAWIWLLLPLALGWGLWRREKGAALIGLWWFGNLVAANPQWLRLPGAGSIDGYTVMIASYIPASILIGASAGWLINLLNELPERSKALKIPSRVLNRWFRLPVQGIPILLTLLVLSVGLWGARERLRDIHPGEYSLVTRPDLRATAWIREHIPSDSIFLVNAFFAFNDTTVVGSDAGWWLPLLAGRRTTLPPINYAFENRSETASVPTINTLTGLIQKKGLQDPEVLDMLKRLKVTHVYIGQQQGRVNYAGPYIIDPLLLLRSDRFRPVYHQDRVWIFEVLP